MHPDTATVSESVQGPDESQAPVKRSLAQRSFNALKWNYLGSFARVGLQFVIGIVLARLLGPDAFGLVAIASLVLGLGALFADFGLASALIQRKEISVQDIRYVFTLQTLTGLGLTIILELSAAFIAEFFKRPDAIDVLHALFLTFAIQGVGQTSSALLRRNLHFRQMQLAQIISYLAGYALLGLPMAWLGFGVWSLVTAQLAQTLLCSLISYGMTRHSVLPCLKHDNHELVQFGLIITATNISNWGLACLDSVVIGRIFGATQLGLYNRSFSLVAMPTYNIVSSLQGVLFSATSRMQQDHARLLQTYLGVLGIMGFICFPIFGVVAVIPVTMISGVYGNTWLAAVPLLMPLALAMPLSALMGLGGPLMAGMGKAGFEMGIQFFSLLVYVPLLWWGSTYTMQVVAWAVFASAAVRFVLMTHFTLRLLQGHWRSVAHVLAGPLVLSGICAGLCLLLDNQLRAEELAGSLRLLIVAACAAMIVTLVFLTAQRLLVSSPVAQLLRQLSASLPKFLQGLIVV